MRPTFAQIIGAGIGGAMFLTAMVIDANEMDEWAPLYLGFGAICTGVGALLGGCSMTRHRNRTSGSTQQRKDERTYASIPRFCRVAGSRL